MTTRPQSALQAVINLLTWTLDAALQLLRVCSTAKAPSGHAAKSCSSNAGQLLRSLMLPGGCRKGVPCPAYKCCPVQSC